MSPYLKRPAVGTLIGHRTGVATVERVHDVHGLTVTVRDRIGRIFIETRAETGYWFRVQAS